MAHMSMLLEGLPPYLFNEHNEEILLSRLDTLDPLALAMATVVTPTLLPFEMESGKGGLFIAVKES